MNARRINNHHSAAKVCTIALSQSISAVSVCVTECHCRCYFPLASFLFPPVCSGASLSQSTHRSKHVSLSVSNRRANTKSSTIGEVSHTRARQLTQGQIK